MESSAAVFVYCLNGKTANEDSKTARDAVLGYFMYILCRQVIVNFLKRLFYGSPPSVWPSDLDKIDAKTSTNTMPL
jgi:hypothetical protein